MQQSIYCKVIKNSLIMYFLFASGYIDRVLWGLGADEFDILS